MLSKRKYLYLFLLALVFFPLLGEACSLPAEPCAAIVPINSTGADMTLVTEGNTFFYVVPQGTTASFKTVWDPAAHNTGNALQSSKYEWCTKAGIAFEPGTDKPNGYGYFPASAMADFFEVQGKGKVVEAFTRTTGVSTADAFVAGDLGPYLTLSTFAQPGQESEVSTIGGQATAYPDSGLFPLTGLTDAPVEPAIDSIFPNHLKKNSMVPITYEGSTKNVYKVSDDTAIEIHGEGLLIEDIQIDLSDIEVTDYKAYIRSGNSAANIEVISTPALLPISADGADGVPGPDYSITFDIPSYNGNKEDSKIKFKVWAPGAGFEITHIYWAWEERVFKKESETRVTTPAVYDASGTLVTPEVTTTKEVWRHRADYKCSEQLNLKVTKPADEAGSTDFIVFDTKGPIAANFSVNVGDGFAETGPTTMDFEMIMLDTNPYFNKPFNDTLGGANFNQSAANMKVQIYYTYPCYTYSAASNLDMNALKTGGYGLADLQSLSDKKPIFKSYKFQPTWVWKRAEVSDIAISPATVEKKNSDNRLVGSLNRVSGKVKIQQPRPWLLCNGATADTGNSDPLPKFKLFAIAKDSQGNDGPEYQTVYDDVGESLVQPTANPEVGGDRAYHPSGASDIPVGDMLDKFSDAGIDTSSWSNLAYNKAKDKIAPEIQVVVFDTRTNKYHVFGSKEHVDAEFSQMGSAAFKSNYADASLNLPYFNKESQINTEHEFTDTSDINGLFTKYLSDANAVSTVNDGSNVAFVCQKNNRLVFYIRAFDNINSGVMAKNFGISSLNWSIQDKEAAYNDSGSISPTDMMSAIEHVFRFENATSGPEYNLTVTAKDYSDNERTFKLEIVVMGRTLDIRTLEERRNRFND
jgi:hypothetical protein